MDEMNYKFKTLGTGYRQVEYRLKIPTSAYVKEATNEVRLEHLDQREF